MLPVCYPSSPSPVTGLPEAVAYALSSVSGLTRWVDYIPIKLVSGAAATGEGKTDVGGFVAIDLLSSDAGLNAWRDYLPVYVDNSATDAWITSAAGYIPYAPSGGSAAAKQFFLNLSNASVGNITDAQGVCTITDVGNINPIISVNRSSGVAPLAVTFDASTTQADPALTSFPFHDLYYAWSFADENGAKWAYGRSAGTLTKNTAYGPVAAHVFESAGSYAVTLWVYYLDSGGTIHSKSTTTNITVTDADTVFAGNTILLSTGTDFTGAPSGTQVANATVTDINTAIAAGKRVLLKRGDTWNITTSVSIANSGPGILGAWGSGNKPKIVISANIPGINTSSSVDWRILDMEVTSDLAEHTYKLAIGVTGTNTLVQRCYLHNVNSGVNSSSGSDGMYIVDTVIEDMFTAPVNDPTHGGPCGFFDVTDRIAILGCSLARSYGSHMTRLQGTSRSVVQNNTYTAYTNFGHNVCTLRGKTTTGATPWNGLWSELNVISDNVFDASLGATQYIVHSGPQSTGHAERVRNLVVERNHVIAGELDAFNFSVTGLTCRNNIASVLASQALTIAGGNAAGVPSPSDNFIYNNTLIKRAITSNAYFSAMIVTGGSQSNIKFTNNLAYGPNCTKNAFQNVNYPEFISTGGGSTSGNYTLSNNSSDGQILSTNPFGVSMPATAAEYTPTGYAVNAGVFVPVKADYYNAAITGTREMGAIQV